MSQRQRYSRPFNLEVVRQHRWHLRKTLNWRMPYETFNDLLRYELEAILVIPVGRAEVWATGPGRGADLTPVTDGSLCRTCQPRSVAGALWHPNGNNQRDARVKPLGFSPVGTYQ
jgi:hypothetical protein